MIISDLFKGPDNKHWELARVSFGVALASAVGYQGYALFNGQDFAPEAFGLGLAAILGGGGLGTMFKDNARTTAHQAGATGGIE